MAPSVPVDTRMKHLFRQDLQDYQEFFYLVRLYPVHPVDSVRKIKLYFVQFFSIKLAAFQAGGRAEH